MRIKEITHQYRRDFEAIYECDHCGHTEKGTGYDDRNFHENVVPKFACSKCGQVAKDTYRPLATKYPDDYQI